MDRDETAHEALMDDLALRLGFDRLRFRLRNALRAGDRTASGQRLEASGGLAACLEALEPRWKELLDGVEHFNLRSRKERQGVGIGCTWYGVGNTALSHPSTIRLGLTRAGRLILYSGAVNIGEGSNTILVQIAADALSVAVERFDLVTGDTDRTAPCATIRISAIFWSRSRSARCRRQRSSGRSRAAPGVPRRFARRG